MRRRSFGKPSFPFSRREIFGHSATPVGVLAYYLFPAMTPPTEVQSFSLTLLPPLLFLSLARFFRHRLPRGGWRTSMDAGASTAATPTDSGVPRRLFPTTADSLVAISLPLLPPRLFSRAGTGTPSRSYLRLFLLLHWGLESSPSYCGGRSNTTSGSVPTSFSLHSELDDRRSCAWIDYRRAGICAARTIWREICT